MILSGKEIIKQVKSGHITIDPFDEENINPNSYNYRLGEFYSNVPQTLSLGLNAEDHKFKPLPQDGLLLHPRNLYLTTTNETIGSSVFVTSLIGRSSVGRLGLFLQLSADLGNLGPAHKWTLELTCIQPLIIYPNMKIGQVSFWLPEGQIKQYTGRYSDYNIPRQCFYELLFDGKI